MNLNTVPNFLCKNELHAFFVLYPVHIPSQRIAGSSVVQVRAFGLNVLGSYPLEAFVLAAAQLLPEVKKILKKREFFFDEE